MAASQSDPIFMYPDPSLFALVTLPPERDPGQLAVFTTPTPTVAAVVAASVPPFPLDPELEGLREPATAAASAPVVVVVAAPVPAPVPAPAPAPAPIAGPMPASRPSAAGLRPFPALSPGLQAPIELTNRADINQWNKQLLGSNPRSCSDKRLYTDRCCAAALDHSGMGLSNRRADTNSHSGSSR